MARPHAGPAPRPVVAFQGSRTGRSAFALINAQWSAGLEASGEYRVVDYDPVESIVSEALIHHDFENHFMSFDPPTGSASVAVRTWDFGPLPKAWSEKINRQFDQYWAPSHWIAEQAEASGVDPDRIRVVPNGVDPSVFAPEGPRFELSTRRSFAFLFVGGVSFRKGTDTLLAAYRSAFTASDDVVLVLKDNSKDLFYRDDTIRGALSDLESDPDAPDVIHIDRFLPEGDLAALYRACDASVFPYRAEGFCIPILESMSCGTPAIVPRFGACLDYSSEATSWFVAARRIKVPVHRKLTVPLGFTDHVDEVDFCEVPVEVLAARMREVRAAADRERAERSAAGVKVAHEDFSWDRSVARVRACLAEMCPPAHGVT